MPNLQSRVAIHMGTAPGTGEDVISSAEMSGVEEVTLTTQQIPAHNHAAMGAAAPATRRSPTTRCRRNSVTITPYLNTAPDAAFNGQAIGPTGGSQPHDNTQPFICINYIISLFGIFPSPT